MYHEFTSRPVFKKKTKSYIDKRKFDWVKNIQTRFTRYQDELIIFHPDKLTNLIFLFRQFI